MKAMLAVMLVTTVAACQEAVAPHPFTLGPGCWTQKIVKSVTNDGQHVTTVIKSHYATCPDSMAENQALWYWDTTFVEH